YPSSVTFRYQPALLLSSALLLDAYLRHQRHRASVIFDCMFASLPANPGWHCAPHGRARGGFACLYPFCVLTIGDLLLNGGAHVLAPLALRASNDVGFAAPVGG